MFVRNSKTHRYRSRRLVKFLNDIRVKIVLLRCRSQNNKTTAIICYPGLRTALISDNGEILYCRLNRPTNYNFFQDITLISR